MADRLSDITSDMQRAIPYLTTAVAELYANKAIEQACEAFPVAFKVVTLDLSADTLSYPLDESIVEVVSAEYVSSSTATPVKLSVFEPVYRDMTDSGWRSRTSATPSEYGIEADFQGSTVTFFPCPDTNTTDGYPRVRLFCKCKWQTLSAGDLVPFMGAHGRPYLVCSGLEKWARDIDHSKIQDWMSLKMIEEKKVSHWFTRRAAESKPQFIQRSFKHPVV